MEDISPIEDYAQNLSLEFVDFKLCEDEKKYTIEECKERDATYAAPLKVKVRLHNKETGEITEHDIFMGDLPLMTDDRYIRNQWCRTCYRKPVGSFTWYLLCYRSR